MERPSETAVTRRENRPSSVFNLRIGRARALRTWRLLMLANRLITLAKTFRTVSAKSTALEKMGAQRMKRA
jgi:hypothetical protein